MQSANTRLAWFEVLSRILASSNLLPFAEDVQRQGRAIAAIGTFAAGLTAAGILSVPARLSICWSPSESNGSQVEETGPLDP